MMRCNIGREVVFQQRSVQLAMALLLLLILLLQSFG
jgi:hypothetical protein